MTPARMRLPCRKLGPPYVGPFRIEEMSSVNSVKIVPTGRFKAISPFQNIKFLRPYHERTENIGPVSQASKIQPVDSDQHGHWYEIDCVVNHAGRPGPNQRLLVRWKGFQDVSDDSWITRKNVTPLALANYERFLREYAKEDKDGKAMLQSFIGLNGQYSCLKSEDIQRSDSAEVSSKACSNVPDTDTSLPARTKYGRVSRVPQTYRP